MQLLLLTTTGARTGQRRAVPLTYLLLGDRYIVMAGNADSDRHPAWYYNLAANPDVTIEVGTEVFQAVAIIAGEAGRGALCELFAAACLVRGSTGPSPASPLTANTDGRQEAPRDRRVHVTGARDRP